MQPTSFSIWVAAKPAAWFQKLAGLKRICHFIYFMDGDTHQYIEYDDSI